MQVSASLSSAHIHTCIYTKRGQCTLFTYLENDGVQIPVTFGVRFKVTLDLRSVSSLATSLFIQIGRKDRIRAKGTSYTLVYGTQKSNTSVYEKLLLKDKRLTLQCMLSTGHSVSTHADAHFTICRKQASN